MKFCDKLQKLRKENNITQEQLADRLDVSRQAVSKWESGGAFPDMDKMISLTKIFNVSMDELINDSEPVKKDINKKMSFMDAFNEMLNFISKTVNMFWAMKIKEKIKCLFEMIILILILTLGMVILVDFARKFGYQIFRFLPSDVLSIINNFIEGILYLGCSILLVIIVIKIFKTRYLDYYVVVTDNSAAEKTIEKPIGELKERKDVKVVIRDPEHSSLHFLKKIGNFFLFLFKCFCIMIAIPVMLGFVSFVGLLVISLFYITCGLFFNGISLAILGGLIIIYLILEFMFNVLFNRTHSFKRIFLFLILGLIFVGVGAGLSINSLSEFEYVYNDYDTNNDHIIEMNDNLVISELSYLDDNKIIIDNNMKDIKLNISSYKDNVYIYSYNTYDYESKHAYKVTSISYDFNDAKEIKWIINNLKDKKLVIDDGNLFEIDKVYISETNLTKIRENNIKYSD